RDCEREGRNDEQTVTDEQEPNPSQRIEPVNADVTEPLLVDPPFPGAPDRQVVCSGQAVPADLAAAHEGKPTVLAESLGQSVRQDDREGRDDCDRKGFALERPEEAQVSGCRAAAPGDGDCVGQRSRTRSERVTVPGPFRGRSGPSG